MEKVIAYKTTDGRTHLDEGVALKEQLAIDIRKLVQNAERVAVAAPSDPVTKVATFLAEHNKALAVVLRKHSQAMQRVEKRNKKAAV